MELQKEWIEKALEDSVMLNPNNAPAQQTHMVAFAEGAAEMLKAVEWLIKNDIENYESPVAIFVLKDILEQLQTIKPL